MSYTTMIVDGDAGAFTFATISITLLVPSIAIVLAVANRIGAAFALLLILAIVRVVGRLTNGTEAFDAPSLVSAVGDLIVVAIGAFALRRYLHIDSRHWPFRPLR